jgi:transcriptional regulator with XRE-family HTH domain
VPSVSPQRIFATNVRRLRVAAGLSQEALADRAGLHRTYISSIERAERNVSLQNIFGIAEALGVNPGDLIMPPSKSGGR